MRSHAGCGTLRSLGVGSPNTCQSIHHAHQQPEALLVEYWFRVRKALEKVFGNRQPLLLARYLLIVRVLKVGL